MRQTISLCPFSTKTKALLCARADFLQKPFQPHLETSHFHISLSPVKSMILDVTSTEYANITFFLIQHKVQRYSTCSNLSICNSVKPTSFVSYLQPKRIKNTATAKCWGMSGKVKMYTGCLVSEIICTGYISLFLDLVVD